MKHHWLHSTRIAYQAPDVPKEPEFESPKGDPHGDEVLESGQDIPLVADPPEPDETPPAAQDPPTPDPAKVEQPKPTKDWRDKEMARRSRRIDEERGRAEELLAENKRLQDLVAASRQQPPAADGTTTPLAKTEPAPDPERRFTQAEVRAEAQRLAAADKFRSDFKSAYDGGASKFGKDKMQGAIDRIDELGGLDYDHLSMILATDEPSQVLYQLGAKPEEFQRIMDLPFNRRIAEFVKMGLKPAAAPAPKKPSGTPPPVEPIGGLGGVADDRYSDKIDDAAWFAAEEKRAAEYAKKKRTY